MGIDDGDLLIEYTNLKLDSIIEYLEKAKVVFKKLSEEQEMLAPTAQAVIQLNEITKLAEVLAISLLAQIKMEEEREKQETEETMGVPEVPTYYR